MNVNYRIILNKEQEMSEIVCPLNNLEGCDTCKSFKEIKKYSTESDKKGKLCYWKIEIKLKG